MQKYRNQILASLGLGFVVIIAIVLLNDIRALAELARAFPWALMLLPLGLRMLNWMLRFIKWHYYLHVVGVRDIGLLDSAALFVSGFTLAVSPGKSAELLKSFILKNMTGAPVAETMPVIAAERLSDGVAVLLLAAISIVALSAAEFWPAILTSAAAMTAGLVLLQYRPASLWLLKQLVRLPLVRRFAEPVYVLYESSYALFRPKSLLIAVTLGTIANFTDGVGVYFILLGVGQAPAQTLFFQALLIISLSVVAGSVSGLPGGLGAADLSIGFLMQNLTGLDPPTAAFVTLLARFVQLWFGVIVGLGTAALCRRRLFPPSLERVIEVEEQQRAS